MSIRKNSETEEIQGNEGTKIQQYFHPHNTLNEIGYSLARFILEPGKRSLLHKLKSSEIYYILHGKAVLSIDGKKYVLNEDDSAYVPTMSEQFIENVGIGDLKFLCIVEPAWKQEDETITE